MGPGIRLLILPVISINHQIAEHIDDVDASDVGSAGGR